MVMRKMMERKPRVENAFQQFDPDGFGFITLQKLKLFVVGEEEELPRSTVTKEAVQRFHQSVRARIAGSELTPDKAEDEWTSSEQLRKDVSPCCFERMAMPRGGAKSLLANARRGLLTFKVGLDPQAVGAQEPEMAEQVIELEGEADSFRAFLNFLQGAEGPTGDLRPDNFMAVLEWSEEPDFGVDHIRGQCEAFLLDPKGRDAIELSPDEILEIAARFNMPKLYQKAVEITGQGMQYLQVPEGPTRFESEAGSMGTGSTCESGAGREMRVRHRLADQMMLPDPHERARLLWKARKRFQTPSAASELEPDWRCLHLVWPHHTLRGEDQPPCGVCHLCGQFVVRSGMRITVTSKVLTSLITSIQLVLNLATHAFIRVSFWHLLPASSSTFLFEINVVQPCG
eukprot:g26055.t2